MSEEEKEIIEEFLGLNEIYSSNATIRSYLSIYQEAVKSALNLIDKLQKELEEKTTILMAGAEKVKELEKENKELKVLADDIKDKRIAYIDTPEFEEKYIQKSKIENKIKEIEKIIKILECKPYTAYTLYGDILHESDEVAKMLKQLLEE